MTKRKKEPTLEDALERPWCYYCERDFDDVRVLHNHQKAKHFKCDHCNKRMKTIGGLRVHLSQTHKLELERVDNAIQGRNRFDFEIFGTEGIPEEAVQIHNQLVTERFYQQQALNRASGGGHAQGQGHTRTDGQQPAAKKIKIETAEEIKARLAEHKAKRAAELAAKNGTADPSERETSVQDGSLQPSGAMPSASPPATSAVFPQQDGASPMQYHASNASPQPQPQSQHPSHVHQPPPMQQPYGYNGHAPPPMQFAPVGPYGGPPHGMPYSPSPLQQMHPQPSHAYSPQGHAQFGASPAMGLPGMPPPPSVSPHYPHQQFTQPSHAGSPPPTATFSSAPPPPQNGSLHTQTPLPALPPGLPQRPAFDAPPVSRSQLHELHYGQKPNAHNGQHPPSQAQHTMVEAGGPAGTVKDAAQNAQDMQPVEHAVNVPAKEDSTIAAAPSLPVQSSAEPTTKSAPAAQTPDTAQVTQTEKAPGKKAKQTQRLVVTDHDVSPEERMAMMPRYAFPRVMA